MLLYRLLDKMRARDIQSTVYSLGDYGLYGPRIAELGVEVRQLGMRPTIPNPMKVLELASWLREFRPNVVQTWMYHADLLGGVAARLADKIPVVWGVRHSDLDPALTKNATMLVAHVCARLSRWLPTDIVCCSSAAVTSHVAMGYAEHKMRLILNGVDEQTFRRDHTARSAVRNELGIAEETPLSGMIARFHNVKNFAGFARAAGSVARRNGKARMLLCGNGVDQANGELMSLLQTNEVADRCILLGERNDIPRIMAALDVLISPSLSEGFPNVLAEAMSCGVACVATDVGDSALIVGDTGFVVPPKDDDALARAWLHLLSETAGQRQQRGRQAQNRIGAQFSMNSMVDQYEALFRSVATHANNLH
ncbi:MAG: glycosyltransferase [Hyphomicrobiaceae bacterium]